MRILILRPYRRGESTALAALFTQTVHAINRRDYSPAQLDAWAPPAIDPQRWQARFAASRPLVAECACQPVGFAEFEPNGHVDMFYVHARQQGQGIGGAMLREIERRARQAALPRLFLEASLTALPFFVRSGFTEIARQEVEVRGVRMPNVRMEKRLG